ncbi:MAG: antibiotic biosynthesis monooxygenase family protein [Pseudomonadota bacterium]
MASFIVRIGIKTGLEGEFEKIVTEIYHATHRDEPGCRRYEYWRCQTPGHYYCLLSFDTYADFLIHQTSDHHEKDAKRLVEIIETFEMEWLDPMLQVDGLKPTVEAAVPDDADDLTKHYAAQFEVQVAAWWAAMRAA